MNQTTVSLIKWLGSLAAAVCGALAVGGVFPQYTTFLASLASGLTAWLHAPTPEAEASKIAKAVALVEERASK